MLKKVLIVNNFLVESARKKSQILHVDAKSPSYIVCGMIQEPRAETTVLLEIII